MKKHFLILASLVLGIGQLFADEVTFSASALYATLPSGNTKIDLPFVWDGAPAPVTVTLAKEETETQSVSSGQIQFSKDFVITVATTGTLDKITFNATASTLKNLSADAGTYASGEWTPDEGNTYSTVAFTTTGSIPVKSITVVYTPKGNVGEDPVTAWTQELTVGVGQTGQIEFTMEGTPKAVAYTSSNTKVATVAANGKVTGVAVGSCTVTTTIDEENGNRWTKETAVTVEQPEARRVVSAAYYNGTDPFISDYLTGELFAYNNLGKYEKWGVMNAVDDLAGVTTYEGKLVVLNSDNCEYKFVGGAWVNVGSVLPKEIETETNYKNMTLYNEETNPDGGWYCRPGDHDHYVNTFNKFVYDQETNTNTIDPYVGQGNWEPYQSFKIEGLTLGDTYKVSFKYSGKAWYSWSPSQYSTLPFYVLDKEEFSTTLYQTEAGGNVLAVTPLPKDEINNKEYAMQFVATTDFCVLAVQFGVCEDGEKGFGFSFADLKIEKVPIVEEYVNNFKLYYEDNNTYTPLAYIESTGAIRENAFTIPYKPVTATEINTKFNVYDTSSGWCAIFCARNTHAGTGISLYKNGNNNNKFGYFTGGTRGDGDNFADFSYNTEYVVTADVTKLVLNGTEYPTGNTVTNETKNGLSLFANPDWDNPMRGRIYYCTIKEGEETIYDFKPVMRHDGTFGFYDAETKLFVPAARYSLEGYSYGLAEDQSYIYFPKETRIVIVGSTAQYLPDVQNLDGATFTWTTSDESIATVAADGTVTGLSAGKVIITATTDADNGWTASYELTVSEPNYVRRDVNGVGYAIITGGNGWGDSPVANLLDNDANTKFGTSNVGEAWAIMIASEPVAVQQYSIVTGGDTYNYPGRNPVSWKLEGSNDNQNWTLIDEKVQTYQLQAKNKEEFEFPVDGTETYKFFKFSATQLADGFQVAEFWINAQEHNFAENNDLRVEPTCTTAGKVVYECSDCHALYVKPIEPIAHAYENGVCTVCSAKASEVVLLPTRGDNNTPYYAKFRHKNEVVDEEYVDIEEGWTNADFDDSAWDELMMPLGSIGSYHTRWFGDYNTFWFRRGFYVENPATITKLTLKVTHDDDCAVFLNGKKVWNEYNWTGGENDWRTIELNPSLLVAGNNVLAMYIEQNWGGAYCDFGLFAQVGATVEVSDAKYATFVAPVDVDFTGADVSAFAAQVNKNKEGYVYLAPVKTVPAGTAVVVGAEAGKYAVPATTDAALGEDNDLVAATAEVVADGTQYILAKVNDKVGFAKAISGTTIAAGKGYLVITDAAVKGFYPFYDEDATGIEMANGQSSMVNAPIYNIAGQRIGKMQKGVNITNGKKVLK